VLSESSKPKVAAANLWVPEATVLSVEHRRVDALAVPDNSRDLIPRIRNRFRDSAMFRRRSEKGYDVIPSSSQIPSRVMSSSDESSRAWQVRPLRFESQSASTSPVALKSFSFSNIKIDIPVHRSEKPRSVHSGHRRVASASIPLASMAEALPSSNISVSDRGISEAASAASRKARSRAVSTLGVCVRASACSACSLAPLT
jgi:hypothetical protein